MNKLSKIKIIIKKQKIWPYSLFLYIEIRKYLEKLKKILI